jgi:CBS domain-containing protein
MIEIVATTPVGKVPHGVPIRVAPETSLVEVVAAMKQARRGAVVVEVDGRLTGVFTERDLMTRIDYSDSGWRNRRVREVMTAKPATCSADTGLAEALQRMNAGGYRRLLIVDGEGRATGVVSIRDILGYIAEHYPQEFVNLPPDPRHEASGQWGA